jgi:hypothetical protein
MSTPDFRALCAELLQECQYLHDNNRRNEALWNRAHAALAQELSSPAPVVVPVPVSERLPGEADCDAEGRCWLLHVDKIGLLEWHFLDRYPSLDSYSYYGYTHWLPAHAIPLPQAGEVWP